ncbi:hypothetical protein C1H46_003917 [Malus baccata]|uniref:Secreted protein n=1 Tax=Malus baccata TaxID=106549 RepID=A0A540NHE1_MALBA|nr:hypothetical protein C1H46_003917 [Malus baccata]
MATSPALLLSLSVSLDSSYLVHCAILPQFRQNWESGRKRLCPIEFNTSLLLSASSNVSAYINRGLSPTSREQPQPSARSRAEEAKYANNLHKL